MCIALGAISTFIYLGSWCAIIYYMTNRPCGHIFIPIAIIIANAVSLITLLDADCNVNYIKTGAATIAVLLLILFINVTDRSANSAGNPSFAGPTGGDQQETGGVEEGTGGEKD